MYKTQKIIKKLKASPILLVFLIGATVASAGIFGFFYQSTTTVTTTDLFLIDNQSPSEYSMSNTITNAVGGNVYEVDHWINASDYIQNNITLSFTWSGNDSADGITPELYYNNSLITSLTIEAGQDYLVTEKFVLDPMITGESYTCVLTVTSS